MFAKVTCTLSVVFLVLSATALFAQAAVAVPAQSGATSTPQPVADPSHPGTFLLTVFLRHDQSKTVTEINAELQKNGWYKNFPPDGAEIVSWNVVMGIGQIVTLRVTADKLRSVNLVFENSAWGGYRTEFYPTYVFHMETIKKQMNAQPAGAP